MKLSDEEWKPATVDLRVEDDEGSRDVKTDNQGQVDVTVMGSSVKVFLIGKSKNN